MTALDPSPRQQVPADVAARVVLPDGHSDDLALFGAYAWLRANSPLAQVHVEGYDPVWLVTKHADVMEVERQPDVFTSGGGAERGSHNPILQNQAGDAFTRSLTGGSLRILETLVYLDPPEHTEVKAVAAAWFQPRNLARWEDRIRGLARDQIATRLHSGENAIDLVKDFTLYYPLHVIMTLFGVPEADEPLMLGLTQEFFGTADPETRRDDVEPMTPEAMARQWAAAIQDFFGYFDGLVEARRAQPQEDLATIIATARRADGELYPKETAYGWFMAIATAGHDTTASTLSTILEQFALDPALLPRLHASPDLVDDLVNEGLRWASPVKHFARRATADYTLRGQRIRRGDRLMLLYQSANRDEEVFPDADTFRIDRRPNRQIAFGHGPHMCIGHFLARQELRIMLEELLPRIERIEVTGPRKVVRTNFVGGLRSLPVRLVLR